ncbi:hypothetical protein Tco_1135295 [Tanacetum coccineum]
MDCDVSWKAKLSTLHDENVLLKYQVESTVKERENIKLEFQKLFNSIKATRAQHQNEINEMFEDVTQKTYAYADVHAQNQDLLMTISDLKSKLKMIDKGKHVNTKFDKYETLGQLLCVTPFNKNLAIKAKNVSNTKVTSDRSNPVTSQSIPIIEKKQQHNATVIARGMYKINQEDTKTPYSKANTNVSNSTGVGSSNSVRRPKSKDNKSKNNVLKNTKSSSTYVLKTTNNVSIDSNKCETKPLNVCQTNACITSSKTVNAGLNIMCISCGLDVFLHSHEKCVARNALTRKSSVKRVLFTSPVAAKSKGLETTYVVAKSRFTVAKTPTTTNKISSVSPLSQKSSQSRILSSYMKNKIATGRKWQKWFEYQQGDPAYVVDLLKPNKVYDPFLKAGLGYTNHVHLKKAIAAQPKLYDGDLIYNNKLLNALYETFVPQQELSAEQTYFSIPSTSDNGSTSKDVPSESPGPKMPTESRTTKHELLKVKLEKSASDSRDIQVNLLKRIKIIENDIQRSQAQSIDFELKLQHQKEKIDCDVYWKAKLSTLHDENVLLKHQVESTVKEREHMKLKFQRLFNSIKEPRAQHQNEINEMIEDVTQNTYAYADVHAQNQDLLMTIS